MDAVSLKKGEDEGEGEGGGEGGVAAVAGTGAGAGTSGGVAGASGEGGCSAGSDCQQTLAENLVCDLSAIADTGYLFDEWQGDVTSTVAFLDSGCDTAHDDLGDPDENYIDGDPQAGDIADWLDLLSVGDRQRILGVLDHEFEGHNISSDDIRHWKEEAENEKKRAAARRSSAGMPAICSTFSGV